MSSYAFYFALLFSLAGIASCSGEESREITVEIQAPDGGWSISIEKVYRVEEELWVISRLQRSPGMAIQQITTVSDRVEVAAPTHLTVRHWILGKTWNWENETDARFISSLDSLEEALQDAQLIYEGGPEGRDEPLR